MSESNETIHDKLVNLITQREEDYHNTTRQILWAILPTLKGIVRFFDISERAANGYLQWEDVVHMSHEELENTEEDVLFVSGRITYDVGEIMVTESGHRIEVTEDNQPFVTKFIKIGVPLSVIMTFDEDATVEFLTEAEIRKNESEIAMQRLAEEYAEHEWDQEEYEQDDHEYEYGSEIGEVDFSELIAKINANMQADNPEPVVEFDVEKLTPEQKASYLMYLKTSSKQ